MGYLLYRDIVTFAFLCNGSIVFLLYLLTHFCCRRWWLNLEFIFIPKDNPLETFCDFFKRTLCRFFVFVHPFLKITTCDYCKRLCVLRCSISPGSTCFPHAANISSHFSLRSICSQVSLSQYDFPFLCRPPTAPFYPIHW